ncbi:MAG: hypothetical protein RR253_06260 [Oscillospiraceae bacterium]
MSDIFYKIGYCIAIAVPVLIALFCLYRIRKNRREIERYEQESKKD